MTGSITVTIDSSGNLVAWTAQGSTKLTRGNEGDEIRLLFAACAANQAQAAKKAATEADKVALERRKKIFETIAQTKGQGEEFARRVVGDSLSGLVVDAEEED